MGYAVYEIDGRFCGYGVPSICDYPDCTAKIDRGFSYCCGGSPMPHHGCGQYFCAAHLFEGMAFPICEQCHLQKTPFPKKPDTKEWINHMLTDDSWQEWRDANPEKVKSYSLPLPQ